MQPTKTKFLECNFNSFSYETDLTNKTMYPILTNKTGPVTENKQLAADICHCHCQQQTDSSWRRNTNQSSVVPMAWVHRLWPSGLKPYSLVGRCQTFVGTCCSFLGLKNIYFFNTLLHFLDKLSKSNSACMGKIAADQLLSRVKKGKLIST
jgi:hypothetical protein